MKRHNSRILAMMTLYQYDIIEHSKLKEVLEEDKIKEIATYSEIEENEFDFEVDEKFYFFRKIKGTIKSAHLSNDLFFYN